jgi:hypothetical protein
MWKRNLVDTIKNIPGTGNPQKMVAFAVDDYGNVRLNGPVASRKCLEAGFLAKSRFDAFDTLETKEDLEALFEVLMSHRDIRGNHAVFTPYAVTGNVDLKAFVESNGEEVKIEALSDTFVRQAAEFPEVYAGAWDLWKQGLKERLLMPQFHGGEHFNRLELQRLWMADRAKLQQIFETGTFAFLKGGANRGIYAAFEFNQIEEIKAHESSLQEGVQRFESAFGYAPVNFTPPNYSYHQLHLQMVASLGTRYIDTAMWRKEHVGGGKYRSMWHYQGQELGAGTKAIIRNAVFEPEPNDGIDWVQLVLKQAEIAFFWNKPLLISTHRVNFCGWMNAMNRTQSLEQLDRLLLALRKRWPELWFVSADEMCAQMFEKQ